MRVPPCPGISLSYRKPVTDDNRTALGLSFGAVAELYDRSRPTYPEEAVRWGLEPAGPGPLRVVDLGAGTGIMSRVLIALGHEVVAVEPDPNMRRQLEVATAGHTAMAGTAEAIPLPEGSVDAVVAAQCYHWFNVEYAHREIARVLRPGGVFCPIWNERAEGHGWLAEIALTLNGLGAGHLPPHVIPDTRGTEFGPIEHECFIHSTTHTVDSLLDLIRSRSYYITASPQRRGDIDRAVRVLAEGHPDLESGDTFELPYETHTYRAVRRCGRTPDEDR